MKEKDQARTRAHTNEIDLKEVIVTLKDNKWFIAKITTVVFFAFVLMVIVTPTKYESTALIQVDNEGASMTSAFTEEAKDLLGGRNKASATDVETALLQSRFILQPTIESLSLNITIKPKILPIVGHLLFDKKTKTLVKPFLGLSKYAWGGESVKISQFDVPEELLKDGFILKAEKDNSYSLLKDGRLILQGKVGKLEITPFSDSLPKISIFVSELNANPDTEFSLSKTSIFDTLKILSKNLAITDMGNDIGASAMRTTQTGILSLSLKGTDKDMLPAILNTVIDYDIQKNSSKKILEAQKTLVFLSKQAPILRQDLDKAETLLSDYRTKHDAIASNIREKTLFDTLIDVSKNIEGLKLRKEELLQNFTEKHPLVIAVNQQQIQLKNELKELGKQISKLPAAEQKIMSLERDVKVKEQLYILMLNKMQGLQVARAGIISDVRVLDYATPALKLPSKTSFTLAAGLLLGLMLSSIIVLLRKSFACVLESPAQIENTLSIPIYAVIPRSKPQESFDKETQRKLAGKRSFILANEKPKDIAVEGLRSLKATLQITSLETKNNVISILGTSPDIGKSFVALNLSYVLGNNGKKVILIDADMRKGKVHQHLNQMSFPGLAEILLGKVSPDKAIRNLKPDHLDFIACGAYPESPFDLLATQKFKDLMQSLSLAYDLVIIDTPPLLAVGDSLLIAPLTGINLLVVGLGKENLSGLEHCVKRFEKNYIKIDGLVLNSARQQMRYYDGHAYEYYAHDDDR